MDLSLLGQSRKAVGRPRAALSGLGPWVGAQVASPRGPILRPSTLSVSRRTVIRQIPFPSSWLATWPWPSPVSVSSPPSLHRRDQAAFPSGVTLAIAPCKRIILGGSLPRFGSRASTGVGHQQSRALSSRLPGLIVAEGAR
jgi:hypothetical protein